MSHHGDLGSIFPLPLVPFEAMMVRDDRDDYPMTCAAEFKFLGTVNRAALESALKQTARRHPLCTSLVRQRDDGQLYWDHLDSVPPLVWLEEGQEDGFATNHPIDLSAEIALRVSVMCGSDVARLRFDFHHACCDAAGGMAFVEDVLVFYAMACGQSATLAPRPLNLSSLCRRGQIKSSLMPLWSTLQSAAAAACQALQLVCRPSLPLAAARNRTPNAVSDWHSCRYIVRKYDETRLRELRHEAARRETTLNDLMIKNLLCTLQAWEVRQRSDGANRALRIVIPVNLRDKADANTPACNKFGYMFVSARMRDFHDEARLLHGIRRAAACNRRYQLPQWSVRVISVLVRLPRVFFRRVFSAQSCHATAVFTNLGDPTRRFSVTFPRDRGRLVVGDLVLDEITSTAPIRPNTRAVFSMNTYANQLTMTARFDPSYYSRSDAEYLLRDFAERSLSSKTRVEAQPDGRLVVEA